MKIHGLSTEQKNMMDTMFEIHSRSDLCKWRAKLPKHERIMSETLEYLMVVEFIDDLDDNDYSLAAEIIEKFKSTGA